MSRNSGSLELSEFFNNDDSNGYRLAEFLQKRRGGVQSQKLLFVESEPLRLSVDVQLEKLPQIVQNDKGDAKEPTKEVRNQPEKVIAVNEKAVEDVQPGDTQDASKVVEVDAPTNSHDNIGRPVSPSRNTLPLSPRLAAIRKSGGISPSDRLRRLSLKRLSRLSSGRRTLLREFEDTVNDSEFAPQVCSTPLSQEPAVDIADSLAKPSTNVENIAPNTTQENNIPPNGGTFSWSASPAQALENKGDKLRRMMESIVETTLKRVQVKGKQDEESERTMQQKTLEIEQERNSTLRRTYTLEKGHKPGQVILTPEAALSPKSVAMDISGLLTQSQRHCSSKCVTRTPQMRQNCSHISHKSMECNQCPFIGEQVSMTNITQQTCHCSAVLGESDLKGGDHFPATKHLTDMDITPPVHHVSRSFSLRSRNDCSSSNKVVRTHNRIPNRSQLTISFDNPHVGHTPEIGLEKRCLTRNRSFAMLNRSNCGGGLSSSRINHQSCPATPPATPINQQDVSCIEHSQNESFREKELVIPETQEQMAQGRNSIIIESPNQNVPFVVIPVSQTFNSSLPNKTSDAADVVEQNLCSSNIAKHNSTPIKSQSQRATINESNAATDNLKLTDILTDDEDEPLHNTMTETNMSNNQAPLNLVGGASKDRIRRLRKRSISRRLRLQKNTAEVTSPETEAEPLPLSLSNRRANHKRSFKQRQVPLNKAPGAPLNGEEFAKELARMSNYEILDLRKRNSMGQVFAICGRNSLWEKGQAVKKQVKLDDEIEMELLRRTMELQNNDPIQTLEETLTEINNEADDTARDEAYPPAPQEFCDSMGLQTEKLPGGESSLVDEKSCDRISFVTRKESLRQRKKDSMPDVLQHYLKVSKKFSVKKKKKRRSINSSKRSLYTRGLSESEDTMCNSSSEKITEDNPTMTSLPYVPSPPRSEADQMPPLRVVSPPPPLSASLENLQRTGVDTTMDRTQIQTLTIPPPPHFETDSGVETNSSSQSQQTALGAVGNRSAEDVFKKPLPPPPPKRKKVGRKKGVESSDSTAISSEPAMSETSSDTSAEGALRRSKRGHVPLKNTAPLFQMLFQQVLNKQIQNREKKIARDKKKLRENTRANIHQSSLGESSSSSSSIKSTTLHRRHQPLAVVPETAVLDIQSHENAQTNSKKKSKRMATKVTRKAQKSDTLECSRISMATPPPLDHFNNVFDHLRNVSQIDERASEKENQHLPDKLPGKTKLRVRVARVKMNQVPKMVTTNTAKAADAARPANNISHCPQQTTAENSSTVSSTNDTKQSNFELISWLKNITDAENTARNDDIFKEMRISSACNLCFTELQGVEYAFYDTDDKASLGYLRFKPRQIKPKKRAKRYHLHFVTLVGNFRITANDKESIVGPGDLVAIEKSIYYDIENISDDIGILMVIKK